MSSDNYEVCEDEDYLNDLEDDLHFRHRINETDSDSEEEESEKEKSDEDMDSD